MKEERDNIFKTNSKCKMWIGNCGS